MGQSSERGEARRRKAGKKRSFGKHQAVGSFSYSAASDVPRLIALVAGAGDRISFGYTSAGACASVSVLSGNEAPDTFYARNEDEWNILLDDILAGYDEGEKEMAWA